MKRVSYLLELKQKRGDDIVTIDFGNWKKIRYKYNKRKGFFEASLVGFDGERKKSEYLDVISVNKTKRRY